MSASDLFELSAAELRALGKGAPVRTFPKNVVVVSEGDRTDSLYVILSGKVKVFLADEDGRQVTLGTQGPGEYFGEMVLDGGPRSASIMTLEPSRFAVVSKEAFAAFLAENREFTLRLVKRLIGRARSLTDSVRSLALMDVYGRVARLLLELAVEKDGARVVPEKLTQQEIAERVAASREMVSLILKDLVAGGYISISRKLITVNKEPPKRW
jgi:CRP/FNR family cyclic AMP-dependent transcriptional regulator